MARVDIAYLDPQLGDWDEEIGEWLHTNHTELGDRVRAEELVGDSQEQQPDHQGLKDHVDKTQLTDTDCNPDSLGSLFETEDDSQRRAWQPRAQIEADRNHNINTFRGPQAVCAHRGRESYWHELRLKKSTVEGPDVMNILQTSSTNIGSEWTHYCTEIPYSISRSEEEQECQVRTLETSPQPLLSLR